FAFLVMLAFAMTLGVVLSMITAFGEEVGWRGYMLTRLVDAGVPHPVLVSGVIWFLYHVPLILTGLYAAGPSPALSAALFGVTVTGGAYLTARLRLQSGSVWPPAVFHATWNVVVQGVFDAFTAGGGASHTDNIWIGESGILVCIANLAVVLFVLRKPW